MAFSTSPLLLAVLGVLAAILIQHTRHTRKHKNVYSIHPLAPAWLSALVASVRLGTDELAFVRDAMERYRTVTWIGWPLNKYLVLSYGNITKVYEPRFKALAFIPVRVL